MWDIVAGATLIFILSGYFQQVLQSSTAVGLALATIIFGNFAYQYLATLYAPKEIAAVLSFMGFLSLTALGGYYAAKTKDGTAKMNTKIIVAFGAVPYLLLLNIYTAFYAFWFLLLAYLPCIYLGYKLSLKQSQCAISDPD